MRSENVIKNSFWQVMNTFVKIIMGFVSRTIFIYFLNAEYLGINGLFTNVLSLLSLAELGFSSAVTFNLYKPLKDDDKERIAAIMNFYKMIYRVVAAAILVIGLCIVPFLQFIVKNSTFSIGYLRITYIIFLLKTVVTYLYSYNYTLITADQKAYKAMHITFINILTTDVLKIAVLIVTRNFIAYLVTEIISSFIFNMIKSMYVQKLYPVLKDKEAKLSVQERKKLFNDVGNIFIGKISTTVLNSTDNIIISAFVSVITVGYMSNYTMLIGYIQGFINPSLYAAQASIGNAIVSEPREYVLKVLKRLTMMTLFIGSFACTALFCLSSDFISILWGKNLLLDMPVVLILMVNSFYQMIKIPLWMTLTTCGFFQKDKFISLVGVVCNIITSVILVQFLGVSGVIWGTIISQTVQLFMKARLLFRDYFEKSEVSYLLLFMSCFLIFGLELGVTALCCNLVGGINDIAAFVIKMIICAVVPNLITVLLFHKTDAFQYTVGLIKKSVLKRLKK